MKPKFPKCFKETSKPHKFCPGCGHGLILKELGFAIDELGIGKKCLIGLDIGCSLLAWDFFNLPSLQTHHGRTVPVVSGYKHNAPKSVAIGYMGDGGGYAIGLQSLLTSALRNDPITVILVNNTLYGMTGGQMAPTTLCNDQTATTKNGKNCLEFGQPFKGPEIIKSLPNKNSLIIRSTISQPNILRNHLKQALNHQINKNSFSFVEVLSICPTNWRMNAEESFKRLNQMEKTFETGIF